MTNQEILTKAVEKAIAGGWIKDFKKLDYIPKYRPGFRVIYWNKNNLRCTQIFESVEQVIFNHDFAKSIWPGTGHVNNRSDGEGPAFIVTDNPNDYYPEWVYHLERMVVADDPIKYLGENI